MRNLIELLARIHRWLLFVAVWAGALAWMNSTYGHHRTLMARWSMRFTQSWMAGVGQWHDWETLSESNQLVMLENARLRAELEAIKSRQANAWETSHANVLRSPGWDNSPWMVLDRGGRDGLAPGDAVLSMGHAGGKVVDTTAHEALVLTLTHPNAQWSVRVGKRGEAGRLMARPGDVHFAILTDVPRAQLALPGDTVMTTGFDGVFPADVAVGLVEDALGGKGDEFQTLLVKLGANYPQSRHVLWLHSDQTIRIDALTENTQRP